MRQALEQVGGVALGPLRAAARGGRPCLRRTSPGSRAGRAPRPTPRHRDPTHQQHHQAPARPVGPEPRPGSTPHARRDRCCDRRQPEEGHRLQQDPPGRADPAGPLARRTTARRRRPPAWPCPTAAHRPSAHRRSGCRTGAGRPGSATWSPARSRPTAAPTKIAAIQSNPNSRMTTSPPTNGTTNPPTAAYRPAREALRRFCRSSSVPIHSIIRMTPSSPMTSSPAPSVSSPSSGGPRRMPASSSPRTAG